MPTANSKSSCSRGQRRVISFVKPAAFASYDGLNSIAVNEEAFASSITGTPEDACS